MRHLFVLMLVITAVGGPAQPIEAAIAPDTQASGWSRVCEKTSLLAAPLPAEAVQSQATFEPVSGQKRTSQVPVAGAPAPFGSGEGALPMELAPRATSDVTNQGMNMPSVPMAIRAAAIPIMDSPTTTRDDVASGRWGNLPPPFAAIPAEADPSLATQEMVSSQPASARQPQLQLASDATPVRSERCGEAGALMAVKVTPEAELAVSAYGFASGETVSFWIGGTGPVTRLGSAAADHAGNLDAVRVPLPAPLSPDVYGLAAVGQTSGRYAQVNILVTGD